MVDYALTARVDGGLVGGLCLVTTQRHRERWELRGSRWLQTDIVELGGTVTVDGERY